MKRTSKEMDETPIERPRAPLTRASLDADPIRQFARWFEEAEAAGCGMPNAVALATATRDGIPSVRMVLMREFDDRGFTFYTNYDSQKGQELATNPRGALCFYWVEMGRQVRVSGPVSRTSTEESERYFHTRPLDSQLGAWASEQSTVIASRDVLDERIRELIRQYENREVPLPPYWGGYRLAPDMLEFWQERTGRLHDRLRYRLRPEGGWQVERLSP